MSYLPPHRRRQASLVGNVPQKPTMSKQEHREQFPCLRGKDGNAIKITTATPVVNWKNITYEVEELPRATPNIVDDGWVNLSVYTATPDITLTTAHLLACAERLENNWRRYYLERDLSIPSWITDNPYEQYEDFDRTIPYSSNYVTISDTDSSSSLCDEEEDYISDHSM